MPKKSKLNKPIRAVQLTIWLTPLTSGKVKVDSTIKHKCKDKQVAIDLIKEYIKQNERDTGVKA